MTPKTIFFIRVLSMSIFSACFFRAIKSGMLRMATARTSRSALRFQNVPREEARRSHHVLLLQLLLLVLILIYDPGYFVSPSLIWPNSTMQECPENVLFLSWGTFLRYFSTYSSLCRGIILLIPLPAVPTFFLYSEISGSETFQAINPFTHN